MKKNDERKKWIIESKDRCQRMGLAPDRRRLTRRLSSSALVKCQKDNELFIASAFPYMKICSDIFRMCGSIIVLTDKEGYVIKVIGPDKILRQRIRMGLTEGVSLREEDAGTNAVALSIKHKEPVFVAGKEYYLKIFQKGACFSAPIFNNHTLLGTIVIVHPHKIGHPHTFALVQTLAMLIEKEYENVLEGNFVISVCNALHTAIVVTDLDGVICYLNPCAGKLLKIEKGKNITGYFDEKLLQRQEIINEVIYSERVDKNFLLVRKAYNKNYLFLFELVQEELEKSEKINSTLAKFTFDDIIGLKAIKKEARRLAHQESNILIIGESGTGKELLASAIHNESKRAAGRFVAVNCNTIPENLFEAELFGYKKGAFTDAKTDREGKIAFADKGTLFLDEVGDLPLDIQGKLLRVLEDRVVCRLGSNEEKKIDVRFIFATNKNLKQMVRDKKFRDDLYYRIYSPVIRIPALRERKKEIPELVWHIFLKLKSQYKNFVEGISEEAIAALTNYDFPGNVRELEGILRQAYLFCKKSEIGVDDLGLKSIEPLSIEEKVKQYKAKLIYECFVLNNRDIKKTCVELKLSERQLYRYLRMIKENKK